MILGLNWPEEAGTPGISLNLPHWQQRGEKKGNKGEGGQ